MTAAKPTGTSKPRKPRTLTVSQQSPSLMPVEVASAAGAARSGWIRTGDGPWVGWVIKKKDDVEVELAVEEVAAGWQVTDEDGHNVASGRELLTVLKKVLG